MSTTDPACVCGHPRPQHEHYRAGSECSSCDCPRFRSTSWWRRLLKR